MVVRGLTKHNRATFSPWNVVGWTNAICDVQDPRHQDS